MTEEQQVEMIESLKMSSCEHHFGLFVKLPDGTEVTNHDLEGWLKDQGIDFDMCEVWDLIGSYDHCDEDMADEDFNTILRDMFND